jgi:ribosomal protein L44E
MSEHLQEKHIGTEILAWCRVCGKYTRHRVDRVSVDSHAGKIGACLEHRPKTNTQGESKKQEISRLRREKEAREPRLIP